MNDLTTEAHNVQLALKDAHSLVGSVQSTMEDTKAYIEIQNELLVKGKPLDDKQLDLWEMTLESLLNTLN